jgi:hypothetical protein
MPADPTEVRFGSEADAVPLVELVRFGGVNGHGPSVLSLPMWSSPRTKVRVSTPRVGSLSGPGFQVELMVRGVRLGVTAKTLARGRRFNSAARERVGDGFRKRNQVVVCIGLKTVVILPDEDVDLGVIGDDELIVTGEKKHIDRPQTKGAEDEA